MTERLSSTAHGDAPLSAAYKPDARAAALWGTEEDDELIARTMTIDRPAPELHAFLRKPANLRLLVGDEVLDVDWEGVVIEEGAVETPGRAISWHSGPAAAKRFSGRIDIAPAPADRGTEVTFAIALESRSASASWSASSRSTIRASRRARALRRFKQLMETGEISNTQPGPAAPRS